MNTLLKLSCIAFFALMFININSFSQNSIHNNLRGINTLDSVIFDLDNSSITTTHITIPVLFKSDDVVNALDFAFKFDETKLTYDSLINYKSYLFALASFNQTDRFLRFTSSSLQTIENNTVLIALRFSITGSCINITSADFNTITAYLNGDPCSYRFKGSKKFKPVAQFTNPLACANSAITFTDNSSASGGSITNWNWTFGDGNSSALQNPSNTYVNSGNYNVTLIVTSNNGCKDTIQKQITVGSLPVASFTSTYNCTTNSATFNNTSTISGGGTIANWNWTFGDGNFSILQNPVNNYSTAGTYTVTLIATSNTGCKDTASNTITIVKPIANFGFSSACVGASIAFSDSSTISSGSITTWSWAFGDGNLSASQNPSHSYANSGTYNVTLIVTSNLGCTDTLIKQIIINPKPVVKFDADTLSGCLPLTVNFSDSSVTSIGSNYLWNFGDNSTSTLQNPTHTYSTGATFTVKLIVTAPGGCIDSLIKINYISVNIPPVANFGFNNGCTAIPVSFSDSSTIASGTITGWSWNFGDGNNGTTQNPSHTYTTSGTFTVTLIVTSNSGCKDTISKTITIDTKPVVNFAADTLAGCSPLLVSFSDSTVTSTGSSYLWNFGDNTTSTSQNPSHNYSSSGAYSVTLVVTSQGGCVDSMVKTNYISVYSNPVANFLSITGCSGTLINFTDSSYITTGSITGWDWDFDNGNNAITQNPSQIFNTGGTYNVSLIVTSNQGCKDTVVKPITIDIKPTVKFGANIFMGCAPLTVVFTDSSITPANSTYYWTFGDGNFSVTQNGINNYTAPGIYTVKHYVTTPGGCVDSLVKTNYISVYTGPVALFSASPSVISVQNGIVTFTNQSIGYTSMLWDFGDGNLSTITHPTHTYNDTGTYTVCLTVQNIYGCTTTYCDSVKVLSESQVAVPSAFTPNGDGSNDYLKVKGGPLIEMDFKIFNEWGNLIYSSNIQEEGWDGKFKGADQPVGSYEYILKGKTTDNETIDKYGVVNLVR